MSLPYMVSQFLRHLVQLITIKQHISGNPIPTSEVSLHPKQHRDSSLSLT